MQRRIIMILISFIFAIVICGASAAVTNETTNETQNSSVCVGDPIINGTVKINEFGHIRNLANATVIINSTSGRTLATTTTDENGYYSVAFYSTATQFRVTTSYMGCANITNTVNVVLNATDGIYYGTSNFTMTPILAQYTGTSNYGENVWVQGDNIYGFAGALNVRAPASGGSTYTAFCIDIYTMIYRNDYLLVNGPLPGTTGNFSQFLLNGVDWGKVNYIISHYSPTTDTEAAAMQCAIWYFTSAPYGVYGQNTTSYYQFLTYNSTFNATRYDGMTQGGSNAVVNRAWQMINSAVSMNYPASITVDPTITRALNGQSVTVTATVRDQNGNPLPGITVNFTRTSGNLSIYSGVTNALGQISTVLSGVASNVTANVIASITGNYGNLLYDDQYNATNKTQNLVAINLLPNVVSATSIINFDVQANVELTQTVTTPVNVGDTIRFVVTAKNNGPNTATGIMISDIVPAGFTATPSAGTSFVNGVWIIPSLTNGANATLTITGIANTTMAGTDITNFANRTAQDQYNSLATSTSATAHVKKADVTISQIVNSPVNVGDNVTYQVTVTNNGPDTATNINIRDILPAGFTAGTPTVGTYNSTTGIWFIPSLANGINAILNITGIATSAMAGNTTNNTATWLNQTEYDPTPSNSTIGFYTKKANVAITQTVNGVSSAIVNVGNTITYLITVINNGPDNASGLVVTDLLVAGLTNIAYSASNGNNTYNLTSGIWNIGNLLNGNNVTLSITGTVTSAWAGLNITNYANRTAQTEYNSLSNTTNTTVYTKKADVSLSQTGSYSGNVVTFIVTARNNGPDNATNINIRDLIPAGLTGWVVTPSVGTYDDITGIWNIGLLENGTFATLNITGNATPTNTINNTATWLNQTEYDPNTPNTTTLGIYVPSVDVSVVNYLWYYDTAAHATQEVYYCDNTPVFVVNVATSSKYDDATGVILRYTLGDGFILDGYDTMGIGTVTISNNIITWNIGMVPKGGSAIMKVFTRNIKTGNKTASLTTLAEIIHVDQTDVNNTNNNATAAIITPVAADIGVNQTQNTVTEGSTNYVIYTITAVNNGPDNATGVQITDKLPTGLTFYKISLDGGLTWLDSDTSYNRTSGVWNIGNFNYGDAPKVLMIKAIITGTGTIKNRAVKTAETEYDWNLENNSQTCILDMTGIYNQTTDVSVVNYLWYYDTAAHATQEVYYCDNTPVFVVNVAASSKYDDATGVILRYTLGDGFILDGYDTMGIGTVTISNNIITWNIGMVPKGGSIILKVFARNIKTGNKTASLTTLAEIIHVDQTDVNNTNNNATAAIITPVAADIGVNQTQNTVTEGSTNYVIYTITAVNNGPDNATGVQITDKLPTGLTFYKISLDGGLTWLDSDTSYNQTSGVWNIGNFNYGDAPKVLMIKAIITGTGTIKNRAVKTAETEYDWNLDNNSQTCILSILP